MTTKEFGELEGWIADHVFRHKWYLNDGGDAMDLLEKCTERLQHSDCDQMICITRNNWEYVISTEHGGWFSKDNTLPVAICIFAKKMFEKATNNPLTP